jgi:hypothetical protein
MLRRYDPGIRNPNGYGHDRKGPHVAVPVRRLDITLVPVFRFVNCRNNPIKGIHNLITNLLGQSNLDDKYEIIPAYVTYKAVLRLPVADDIQNQPSRHPDNFVATAEAVIVVEGGEHIAFFKAILNLPVSRSHRF